MKASIFAAAALIGCANCYYSGEIRTREPFRYGKFKTRIKAPDEKGTVTSFFTFWNGQPDLPWSVAEWEEIDIEIVPSKAANPLSSNIIWRNRQMDFEYYPNFDPMDDWHDYEIIWKPNEIIWYLDG